MADLLNLRDATITISIVATVNIPALSAYVDYLQSKNDAQAQIDALTTKVEKLTSGLSGSSTGLDKAVKANQSP